jgi:hypothetical protein
MLKVALRYSRLWTISIGTHKILLLHFTQVKQVFRTFVKVWTPIDFWNQPLLVITKLAILHIFLLQWFSMLFGISVNVEWTIRSMLLILTSFQVFLNLQRNYYLVMLNVWLVQPKVLSKFLYFNFILLESFTIFKRVWWWPTYELRK